MKLPEVNAVDPFAVDTGSFRDRDGRIYRLHGRILRGLSEQALEEFRKLQSTGFYTKFLDRGQLVRSELLPPDQVPLPPEIAKQVTAITDRVVADQSG